MGSRSPRSIPVPARLAGLIVVAAVLLGAVAWFVDATDASAATPCSLVRGSVLNDLYGTTTDAGTTELDFNTTACRIEVGNGLTVAFGITQGGQDRFDALRQRYRFTQKVADYVDGAYFGWGRSDNSTVFVARRGDDNAIVRITGSDSDSDLNFNAAQPKDADPHGDISGSVVGSSMWVVSTNLLTSNLASGSRPTVDNLGGLWRTADITPCDSGDTGVRISLVADSGSTLVAKNVIGDGCLAKGATDFASTTNGRLGGGRAFGVDASTSSGGVAYKIKVDGPTKVVLTGTAGAAQYTHTYERLTWQGLLPIAPVSGLLGLPTPKAALTTKNVALSGAVIMILLLLVVFPTTLFNTTLEANMKRYRTGLKRVGHWPIVAWVRNRFRKLGAGRGRGGSPRLNAWQRPGGVLVYLAIAAGLYSLLQPAWGLNVATLITLIGFIAGQVATTGIGLVASRLFVRMKYRESDGHPDLEPSTLGIAAFCVIASRVVGFVPGYCYGVVVHWDSKRKEQHDPARILMVSTVASLLVGIAAWVVLPYARSFGGTDLGSWRQVPLALVSGIFVSTVDNVTLGLIPLKLLPGHMLREYQKWAWRVLWGLGLSLFVLVLLQPGLVKGTSKHVIGTLVLAAGLAGVAVLFWFFQRNAGESPATPGIQPWPSGGEQPATG